MNAYIIAFWAACLLGLSGCQSGSSGRPQAASHGLLERLGLGSDQVVQLVVDTGSRVIVVRDHEVVRRFYNGVDDPAPGRARHPLDELIGFVRADGRTMVGGFNRTGGVSFEGSLGKAVSSALLQRLWKDSGWSKTASLPPFTVASASLINKGRTLQMPQDRLRSLQAEARRLVGMWNPESLEGCAQRQEDSFVSDAAGPVVMLSLAKPIRFRCFVRNSPAKGTDWPPDYPQWAGSYRTLTCRRLAVSKDEKGRVLLAFSTGANGRVYVTQRLHLYNKQDQETYGTYAKLYGELVRSASPSPPLTAR